jgi:8-oxo-dGTP diphosphatase
MSSRDAIVVLAAVIVRGDRVLLARRPDHVHLGGRWEFPGGKCEPGESHEACLRRELDEELGVRAVIGREILVTEHAYPDRVVRLHFRWCRIDGDPVGRLGQELRWAGRDDLSSLEFPEADREIVGHLADLVDLADLADLAKLGDWADLS